MGGHRRVKRTFHKGQELRLTIEDMAFGGKGIARVETEKGPFVVFVKSLSRPSGGRPSGQSAYAECRLLRVVEPADFEVDLPYQPIPGAPYATVPMEKQHEWKARTALDLYRKIGEVEDLDTLYQGFVPSPLDWHYRNKMEYSFSEIRHDLETDEKVDDFGLGFKHRGTWWAVENLDADSGLFDALVESTLHKVREWCENTGLPAWHPPKREGFFRFLVVRKSYANDGLLVNLVTTSDAPLEQGFVECIRGLWGDRVKGVLHTLNDDKGERVEAREGVTRDLGRKHRHGGVARVVVWHQHGVLFPNQPHVRRAAVRGSAGLGARRGGITPQQRHHGLVLWDGHHWATRGETRQDAVVGWTLCPAPLRTHAKRPSETG